MSTLTISQPTDSRTEESQEQIAVLLLAQAGNRTAIFQGTPLQSCAKGLTQAATRWRHRLSDADRVTFAHLNALDAALAAFREWVSPATQAEQALKHCREHPEDRRLLMHLFQVDALLDKWALLKEDIHLFASDVTAQAVILFAEERVMRQMVHEAVGHTAKELEKKGLSLPPAAADDARALLSEKIAQLFTPETLGFQPSDSDALTE